jgi:hypothetical protein
MRDLVVAGAGSGDVKDGVCATSQLSSSSESFSACVYSVGWCLIIVAGGRDEVLLTASPIHGRRHWGRIRGFVTPFFDPPSGQATRFTFLHSLHPKPPHQDGNRGKGTFSSLYQCSPKRVYLNRMFRSRILRVCSFIGVESGQN